MSCDIQAAIGYPQTPPPPQSKMLLPSPSPHHSVAPATVGQYPTASQTAQRPPTETPRGMAALLCGAKCKKQVNDLHEEGRNAINSPLQPSSLALLPEDTLL
ncbi:hypothetical protein JZ751_011523, partial [Albula glossodonta]